MASWPDPRFLELAGIQTPIVQAPMAGADSVALARAVSSAGALGSLACALLNGDAVRESVQAFRDGSSAPINLNFFCHTVEATQAATVQRWKAALRPHYERLGLDIENVPATQLRMPFDEEFSAVVEEVSPEVVSFHFGLPSPALLDRLKGRGIKIVGNATSVAEAKWLVERGCDAIIAQGLEAGGHRGMFLESNVSTQTGLFALLPRVADAVAVPVIAAGGIADARGIVAALKLGASAVQLGTAYLFCPEARISPLYREALKHVTENGTVVTNLFSGRPARGIRNRFIAEMGAMSEDVPAFPHAATLIAPLRSASERKGSVDYMQMWSGQSAALCRSLPAADLTRTLASEALQLLGAAHPR